MNCLKGLIRSPNYDRHDDEEGNDCYEEYHK
jgi:hypothetical protein